MIESNDKESRITWEDGQATYTPPTQQGEEPANTTNEEE